MRKEEILGLVMYTLMIAVAIIVGFTVIKPLMENYGPAKMSGLLFLLIVVVLAYLINVIGLELLHAFGAICGGYAITGINILGFCYTKTPKGWKFSFKDFEGMSGETQIKPKRKELKPILITWFPMFGYAFELAICVLLISLFKGSTKSGVEWLVPASAAFILISSMIAFYNFVPLRLDSMTDGYRIRLFANKVNIDAFNKVLEIQDKQRLGEKIEEVPVFEELTSYTAEVNTFAMYVYLSQEKYEKAREILDKLLENKQVLAVDDVNRLICQKVYLSILTMPIEDAKKVYDEICPTEIRRFIANDVSLQSIRAYILIAGMIENSESEVEFAKSKIAKARKRALPTEIQTEDVLLEKALKYVYDAHPKWTKENAA